MYARGDCMQICTMSYSYNRNGDIVFNINQNIVIDDLQISAVYLNDEVKPVIIKVKIGDMVCGCWLDYCNLHDNECLQKLTRQDELIFNVYADDTVITHYVSNTLQGTLSMFIRVLSTVPSWTREEFEQEKNNIYQKYPIEWWGIEDELPTSDNTGFK